MPRTDPSRSFRDGRSPPFSQLERSLRAPFEPARLGLFHGTAGNLDAALNAVMALRAAIARGALNLLRIDDATGQRQRGEHRC